MNYTLSSLPVKSLDPAFSSFVVEELRKIEETLRSGGVGSSSSAEGIVTPGVRLSCQSGVAVTSTDSAAASTIYCVRTGYSSIPIYNGSAWVNRALSSDPSLILDATGHAANKEHHVFAYYDGTVKLGSGPAWSTSTSPGTGAGTSEIEYFEGRAVNKYSISLRNNSANVTIAAREALCLGGFATTGTAGTTEDSRAKRLLSNEYNATIRAMQVTESTDSWSGDAGNAWRQTRGSTANQLEFFSHNGSYPVTATARHIAINSTSTGRSFGCAIGLDGTTPALGSLKEVVIVDNTKAYTAAAAYSDCPGRGRHSLKWLELTGSSDTRTFYGDNGDQTRIQTGILGQVIA